MRQKWKQGAHQPALARSPRLRHRHHVSFDRALAGLQTSVACHANETSSDGSPITPCTVQVDETPQMWAWTAPKLSRGFSFWFDCVACDYSYKGLCMNQRQCLYSVHRVHA